jgi:hypothetical protein
VLKTKIESMRAKESNPLLRWQASW